MPNRNKSNAKKAITRKICNAVLNINKRNKSQLKKISKVDTTKNLPQVPLSDLYVRNEGVWTNRGKSCRLCGMLINDPIVIDKHRYICEVLNKSKDDEQLIRVVRGNRIYYRYKDNN